MAARDESLKEVQKDLAKAEWWASLSKRSPQHKAPSCGLPVVYPASWVMLDVFQEILDIKEELSTEQSRAARAERPSAVPTRDMIPS